MKNYIGIKWIQAEPKTRLTKLQNLADENEFVEFEEEGYKVIYEDGYESWSPKDAFEKAYQPTDNLKFGLAIEALKRGKKVARKGWNGKDMFIFMRPSDELSVDMIINKVKSLPKSVKDYFAEYTWLDSDTDEEVPDDKAMVEFTSYICMKTADTKIVNGWLASQTDMLAEDWVILD